MTATLALGARMRRGGAWLLGGNLAGQALRLGGNLVLTRLLAPEAFGLVAVVNTLYFALVMFSDLGVWQSVVRSARGGEGRFLGTAWTLQLLRGLLLAALLLLLALLIHGLSGAGHFAADTVYADHRLPWLLAVFALCAALQGAESMKLALAQRELRLGTLARLELLTQLATLLVTIALAWSYRSVWALVAGSVAGSLLKMLLSHGFLPGPRLVPCWDPAAAAEITGFGKWIFLSSIIGFLAAHGEKLLLGATLTTTVFGVFSIAANLLAAVGGLYAAINGRLIFASLSEALRSGDEARVLRVYSRVQQLADLLLGLASGGLLMAGQWIVVLLYDARYHDAGWMLQWLGLSLLAMRHQVVEQLMFAQGRPALVTANNVLRALVLVLAVPLGASLGGVQGAVLGVVLSQFAAWPLSLRYKYHHGLLSWESEKRWPVAFLAGVLLGWLADRGFAAAL